MHMNELQRNIWCTLRPWRSGHPDTIVWGTAEWVWTQLERSYPKLLRKHGVSLNHRKEGRHTHTVGHHLIHGSRWLEGVSCCIFSFYLFSVSWEIAFSDKSLLYEYQTNKDCLSSASVMPVWCSEAWPVQSEWGIEEEAGYTMLFLNSRRTHD